MKDRVGPTVAQQPQQDGQWLGTTVRPPEETDRKCRPTAGRKVMMIDRAVAWPTDHGRSSTACRHGTTLSSVQTKSDPCTPSVVDRAVYILNLRFKGAEGQGTMAR